MRGLVFFVAPLFGGCIGFGLKESADSKDESSTADICEAPVEHPHDSSKAIWSYHGETDGPEQWGSLPGYETCGTGEGQSPIDLTENDQKPGTLPLTFTGYDKAIPLELLNNGHTLELDYTGSQSATDPQISYDGKTWYLIQFHGHSTSEHTIEGQSSPFELHFVHKATDGSLAVVGLLLEAGEENGVLSTLLTHNPGHEMETSCDLTVTLADVPTSSGFLHYSGSLTTPDCSEGVSWFVLTEHGTVATEQASEWQTEFGGTTNRPTQPLHDRVVLRYP